MINVSYWESKNILAVTIKSMEDKAGYLCRMHETLGQKLTFTGFVVTFGNPVTGSL